MSSRARAWLGALAVALLVGAVFVQRFMRKPPREAPVAEQAPAASLLDRAMGLQPSAPPPATGPRTLAGRVLEEDEQPVAGAQVLLAQADAARPRVGPCDAPERCVQELDEAQVPWLVQAVHSGAAFTRAEDATRSGVDGTFEFQPRGDGPWVVWADEGPRGAAAADVEARDAADGTALLLSPPARLAGRVLDDEGTPIPGAHVHVLGDAVRLELGATAGADGRFSLEVPAGSFALVVDAAGFTPRRVRDSGEELEVVLQRPVACRVTVTRNGRPAPASLFYSTDSASSTEERLEAPAGHARVEGLAPGAALVVRAVDGERVSERVQVAITEEGCEVSLALLSAFTTKVRVEDEHGAAIPGAEVSATALASDVETTGTTNAKGEVQLGPLQAGRYALSGTAPLQAEEVIAAGNAFLAGEDDGGGFHPRDAPGLANMLGLRREAQSEFVLDRPGQEVKLVIPSAPRRCTVSGRAEGSNPGPFTYASALGSGPLPLDDLHRFNLEVPCGLVLLYGLAGGKKVPAWQGAAPASGIQLRAVGPGRLAVHVRSSAGPVAEAMVSAGPAGTGRALPSPGADWAPGGMTDAKGLFVMEGLQAGTYQLSVTAAGLAPFGPRSVEVSEGETKVDVSLEAGARVAGRVVDGRGRGVPEVAVEVVPLDGNGSPSEHACLEDSKPSGRFVCANLLPAPRYRVTAQPDGEAWIAPGPVEAHAGDEGVVLVLGRRPAVTGRVLGGDGRPLEAFLVGMEEVRGTHGRFRVQVDTSRPLEFSADGHLPRTVTLPPGGGELGDLRLERKPAVLGVVRDATGRPVGGAEVTAPGCGDETTTDEAGRFELATACTQLRARRGASQGTAARTEDGAPVTLTLAPGTRLRLRAFTDDGAAAAGSRWSVDCEGGLHAEVQADAAGAGEAEVPVGRCSVSALRELAFQPRGTVVHVDVTQAGAEVAVGNAPGTFPVTVELRPGARRVHVVAEPPAGRAWEVYAEDEGPVRLFGLPPGSYTFRWSGWGPEPREPAVTAQVPAAGRVAPPAK